MDIAELLAQLAVGAIGGLVAFLLARSQFVSEKRWEHLFEIHCELFQGLHDIDYAIANFETSEIEPSEDQRQKDLETYSRSIEQLLRTEERLVLLGADGARACLKTLLVEVIGTQPQELHGELSGAWPASVREWSKEARAALKDSKIDLALAGREELRIGLAQRKNRVVQFIETNGRPT